MKKMIIILLCLIGIGGGLRFVAKATKSAKAIKSVSPAKVHKRYHEQPLDYIKKPISAIDNASTLKDIYNSENHPEFSEEDERVLQEMMWEIQQEPN